MEYRIEISSGREGIARVHLPGRSLELEARGGKGLWHVAVIDPRNPPADAAADAVTISAPTANDAVWLVARAAVRAISELTDSPLGEPLRHDPDDPQPEPRNH